MSDIQYIVDTIQYEGSYLNGRFEGHGTYWCDLGRYTGYFSDGQFHGRGTLFLKDGGKFEGEWRKGKFISESGRYVFEDGLEFKESNWEYCSETDNRFYAEILEDVPPTGPLKYVTANKNNPLLPLGCYDCIDGYFDPKMNAVRDYETHSEIRRPDQEDVKWILKYCRQEK
mmetsp:Transcript_3279/g.3447  ORF Transcript_3279/g.3447 Transcript_3279/m.3447 type:complete len:171 (-) Transcript_3279:119-631(-)